MIRLWKERMKIYMKGNELFDIEGRKAIVTGGTRGLGYGMAEGLMECGCEVVIVGTSDKVFETADEFKKKGFFLSWCES